MRSLLLAFVVLSLAAPATASTQVCIADHGGNVLLPEGEVSPVDARILAMMRFVVEEENGKATARPMGKELKKVCIDFARDKIICGFDGVSLIINKKNEHFVIVFEQPVDGGNLEAVGIAAGKCSPL